MFADGNMQVEVESVSSSLSSGAIASENSLTARGTTKNDVAKLVAQNNELRRLLQEEQKKAKAADDERRKKDQELRRIEVEMDGFRFRNDQLLKRIEVLQSEMSSASFNIKASRKGDRHADANNVVEQELMKRIQENSDLRSRLENVEMLSQEQAAISSKRMVALENDLLAAQQKHLRATSSVKQERDSLSVRCGTLEKQLKETCSEKDSTIQMLEAKLASVQSEVNQHKDDRSVTSSVLLSDGLCPPEYLRLNLDFCDNEQAASVSSRQRSKSSANLSSSTESLILSLAAYGTAVLTLIQRLNINNSALSAVASQAKTSIGKLQNIPPGTETCAIIIMAAVAIEELSASFGQLLSVGDSTFQAANGMHTTLDRIAALTRESVGVLGSNVTPSSASQWLQLAQLASSASGFVHDHYASLVVAFVGRVELKQALDAALQALGGASSALDALSTLFDSRSRSADVIASPLTTAAESLKQHFRTRTIALRASCHISSKPASVPQQRAVELDSLLAKTEAERTALAERAERLSKRLRTAEEERERWMVEAQLRQVRYEKLLHKVTGPPANSSLSVPGNKSVVTPSSSTNDISASSTRSPDGSTATSESGAAVATVLQHQGKPSSKAHNGSVQASAPDEQSAADVMWLAQHFEKRLTQIGTDAQRADSEAASWKAECRALVARLVQARQLSVRVTSLEKSLAERDDELDTVRRGYESQLSAMAEHLATMNERIVKHADESEALQRQLRVHQHQAAGGSSSSRHHSKKLLSKPG